MNFRQTQIKKNLKIRSQIINSIRNFFYQNNYLEVETPIRTPAPAPEENIDAIASEDLFLQTSPELYMKRLLAAGYKKIFQIAKGFRKEERGIKHVPEFTLLEWYEAGGDYLQMMNTCESLITFVATETSLPEFFVYQKDRIDISLPWQKITVAEAFEKYSDTTVTKALAVDKFDEVMAFEIEPALNISKPVFLYDYPSEKGALAKKKRGNSAVAERFELYIGGLELCNAFSELTDKKEQTNRFIVEQEARKKAGKPVYPMSDRFLNALDKMPVACGNALGIDRLIMLFTDSDSIDKVIAFTPEEL